MTHFSTIRRNGHDYAIDYHAKHGGVVGRRASQNASSFSVKIAMDTTNGPRFTPHQSRYTSYLCHLKTHWAYADRVPGRTNEERLMLMTDFKKLRAHNTGPTAGESAAKKA